jgi:hypothetical protein
VSRKGKLQTACDSEDGIPNFLFSDHWRLVARFLSCDPIAHPSTAFVSRDSLASFTQFEV